jgi:hypothetical protein
MSPRGMARAVGGFVVALVLAMPMVPSPVRGETLTVEHASPLVLPLTGEVVWRAKLRDQAGRSLAQAVDEAGNPTDVDALRARERTAAFARFGKLDPALAGKVAAAAPGERVVVGVWLRTPVDPALEKAGALRQREEQRRAAMLATPAQARARRRSETAAVQAPFLAWLAGRGYRVVAKGTAGPLVFVEVPVAALDEIGRRTDVDRIYPSVTYEPETETAHKTERVDVVHGRGLTGAGVGPLAVLEPGAVNFPGVSGAGSGDPFLPAGELYQPLATEGIERHTTHVAGVLLSTHAKYRGVAFGAPRVLSANTTGTDADSMAALDWAVDKDARVVNASYGGVPQVGRRRPPPADTWETVVFAGGQTTLTDTAAPFGAADELVNWWVQPNRNRSEVYRVVASTATTIVVAGDVTANVHAGDQYYVASNLGLDALDRYFDAVIAAEFVTITKSSGNRGSGQTCSYENSDSFITSPGRGYNVITVGSEWDHDTFRWSDDTMSGFSSARNPENPDGSVGDREKPEVVAVGESQECDQDGNGPQPPNPPMPPPPWVGPWGNAGTSFAAPAVAGEAALLMERRNALRNQPAAVKAIVMASACHDIEPPAVPDFSDGIDDRDGAGAIVACEADEVAQLDRFEELFLDTTMLDASFTWSKTTDVLQRGTGTPERAVRVAISWLTEPMTAAITGDWETVALAGGQTTLTDTGAPFGAAHSKIGWWVRPDISRPEFYIVQDNTASALVLNADVTANVQVGDDYELVDDGVGFDWDLRVYDPDDNLVATSLSNDNNYEIVRFLPPKTGQYRIEIQKFSGPDTGGSWMGIAWTQDPCCNPDYGDAPDDMQACPVPNKGDFPTDTQGFAREFELEWLGRTADPDPSATWELEGETLDPANKTQEGVDDITRATCTADRDQRDDGAFLTLAPAGNTLAVTVHARDLRRRGAPGGVDTAGPPLASRYVSTDGHDERQRLFLNVWFDWEGDGIWQPGNPMDPGNHLRLCAGCLGAKDCTWWGGPGLTDCNGNAWPVDDTTRVIEIPVTVPAGGSLADVWYRVRLDYGEDTNLPEQDAVYGEVEDYVLPTPKFKFRARTSARVGNGSVIDGDLGVNQAGGSLRIGQGVVAMDGWTLAADNVKLGNFSTVAHVRTNNLRRSIHADRQGAIRQSLGPAVLPLVDPFCTLTLPPCSGPDVVAQRGETVSLAPGAYGRVRLRNDSTLVLQPGTYDFCSLTANRRVTVRMTGPGATVLNVTGNFRLGNQSLVSLDAGADRPTVNVAGRSVRVGAGGAFDGVLTAPNARLSLGRDALVRGGFCVGSLNTDHRVQLLDP